MPYLNEWVFLLPAFVLFATLLLFAFAFLFLLLLGFLAPGLYILVISVRPASLGALLLLLLCLKPCARWPGVDLCLVLNHVLGLLSLHLDLSELSLFSLVLHQQWHVRIVQLTRTVSHHAAYASQVKQ